MCIKLGREKIVKPILEKNSRGVGLRVVNMPAGGRSMPT